MRTFS